MTKRILFFLLVVLSTSSCIRTTQVEPEEGVGMKPIYGDDLTISIGEPILVDQQGKIVFREPYLLVNEQFRGIHIYDNTDPENPVIIKFLSIPGNIDFSLRGNKIYANSFRDLVTLELDGFETVTELNRIENHYDLLSSSNNVYPQNYVGPFECYDETQGFVLGWKFATLNDPKCFTR